MSDFIGRERELSILESSFGEPCAFLIYGRRRIGKTCLLEHFCEGKRHLFLRSIEGTESDNLQYFADEVSGFTGNDRAAYGSYYEALKDIGRLCAEEPTVVVIDEFQFITTVTPKVVSFVQHFIDGTLKKTESMLILCGSSVRTMRSIGEDGSSPLYGRFKRKIHLGPMSFAECRMFHPGMSDIDCLKLYLTFGGVPRYHVDLKQRTYEECIRRNVLDDGWILDETDALIRAEFSPGARYIAVLSSISNGAVRLKEISEKVKVDASTCSGYLQALKDAGIIGTVNPMLGAPKRPRYFVADNLIAFDREVLVRRRSLIDNKDLDATYRELEPYIDTFLGKRFELFCEEFIKENYAVTEIGKWWMDDDKRGIHEDIDIVARVSSSGNRLDLFAECKFTRAPAGFHVYNVLDRRVDMFRERANERLAIICVSGFEENLAEFAERAHVLLIGPDELFGHEEPEAIWTGRGGAGEGIRTLEPLRTGS